MVPEELAAIARHFASAECVLDPPATSRDLLECDAPPDVLHIACHGDFDVDAPLLARLMLSDRPVFAFEIMLMKLNADIVVLMLAKRAKLGLGWVDMCRAWRRPSCPLGPRRLWPLFGPSPTETEPSASNASTRR